MKNSPSCAHVLHKTLNLVISPCCFAGDGKAMCKTYNTRTKRFLSPIKPFVLWLSRSRCRHRCFVSSLKNNILIGHMMFTKNAKDIIRFKKMF